MLQSGRATLEQVVADGARRVTGTEHDDEQSAAHAPARNAHSKDDDKDDDPFDVATARPGLLDYLLSLAGDGIAKEVADTMHQRDYCVTDSASRQQRR